MHVNVIHITTLTESEGKNKGNYMIKTSSLILGGKIITLSRLWRLDMYILTPRTATKKYKNINPRDKLKY